VAGLKGLFTIIFLIVAVLSLLILFAGGQLIVISLRVFRERVLDQF